MIFQGATAYSFTPLRAPMMWGLFATFSRVFWGGLDPPLTTKIGHLQGGGKNRRSLPLKNHKEFFHVGGRGLFSSDEKSFSPFGGLFSLYWGTCIWVCPHQIFAMHALANDPLFCLLYYSSIHVYSILSTPPLLILPLPLPLFVRQSLPILTTKVEGYFFVLI